jgi:hypothetical protein
MGGDRYITNHGWEDSHDRNEREREEEEDRLCALWMKNKFPLTFDEYLEQVNAETLALNVKVEMLKKKVESETSRYYKLYHEAVKTNQELVNKSLKASKVQKRRKETLCNRISKLLSDYENDL